MKKYAVAMRPVGVVGERHIMLFDEISKATNYIKETAKEILEEAKETYPDDEWEIISNEKGEPCYALIATKEKKGEPYVFKFAVLELYENVTFDGEE